MITLAFAAPQLQQLRTDLRHPSLESAAILLCVPVRLRHDDGWRLLVREIHIATGDAYLERTSTAVKLNAKFCLPLERAARINGWSLVYVHTHPHQRHAAFSALDDSTEAALASYTDRRCPDVPHLSLLFPEAQAPLCRKLGTQIAVRVVEVGANLTVAFDPLEPDLLEERFDRQIRAFGEDGQKRIASLEVGIVGLGGTGSLVAQQLAHIGVRRFVLVDDDTIEESNLNRVVGSIPNDAARAHKVDVAERQILQVRRDASVTKMADDVTRQGVAERLATADFVFSCTDTHSSRHVVNQMAYQYLVPVIDLGVAITVGDLAQTSAAGHVQMLAPGLPCLWCSNHLDSRRVREELMTEEHRANDPYFQGGAGVTQPAVISINGVVASVAVTMFLAAVAGVPSPSRYVAYDVNRSRMNAMSVDANPDCNFCGADSTMGWGETYPLPERRHG